MPERSLRFGVCDGSRWASTWKLWTNAGTGRSEVYLACRSLRELKASLHETGRWHVAYPREVFEERVQDAIPGQRDRFLEKWERPREIGPGMVLAFRVVTPWSSATRENKPLDESILWIPTAPKPRAIEVDILIVEPALDVGEWPGKNAMATSLIGSIALENGATAWAVHWEVPMPDLSSAFRGRGNFYKDRSLEGYEKATAFAVSSLVQSQMVRGLFMTSLSNTVQAVQIRASGFVFV